MPKYDASSIVQMSEVEHLRKHSGMYVGDAEDATRLLEEVLDNSLDEVQNGHADIIAVFLDTKEKTFKVMDNGRGFPFDSKLPLEKDPPVLACTKLFTSGKFSKGGGESAYGVAVGLHGVGLSAVYALSEFMNVEIYRGKQKASYKFTHDGDIDRSFEKFSGDRPFSTKTEVKPSSNYFTSTSINIKKIEDRLLIAAANYPKLKIAYQIDDKRLIIKGSEEDLILKNIGTDVDWIKFAHTNSPESYDVRIGWSDQPPNSLKAFTTVNLCRVESGAHLNSVLNVVKNFFAEEGKKRKLNFQPNDCLVGMRLYLNLKIIKAAFAEQVKDRLSSRSDLKILDNFEKSFSTHFKKNPELLDSLLTGFHEYRSEILSKKLSVKTTKRGKRGFTTLTKLHDCILPGGELFICEGDSAGGGLVDMRDPKKHAILPLRGVVPNAITKKDFHENAEFKDIIISCGCGIESSCDVSKLRYDKIIIATDADPAGHWISALLITFFSYKMSPLVKEGKLYICQTPLFGYMDKGKFHPIWKEQDVEKKREAGKKILRFKGLGEFNPEDLKTFTLDENTRNLIQVKWSEHNREKLFDLMSSPAAKRELILGTWSI